MSSVAERVAAGAAVLDRHRPGWHRQIDLACLDARRDDYVDVLSQLYGDDYEHAISVLYQAEASATALGAWGLTPAARSWVRDRGFDIDTPVWDVLGAYAELADQWRAEIARRQQADEAPGAAEPEAEALRRLAEAINAAHRRGQSTISTAPVDVAGVPGLNLYDHAGPRGPQPLDTVWHVGAGEALPGGGGHATAACFVWGPAYDWSAPTADLQAAAVHVAQTAGRWPDRGADGPVPPEDAPTDQQDHPDPEDAYLGPSGPLGAVTSASLAGVFLGEFDTTQQAEQAIRAEMDRSRFWPNVWWVDDHGGLTLWSLDPADQPPGEVR
jgi:hypothetical protein